MLRVQIHRVGVSVPDKDEELCSLYFDEQLVAARTLVAAVHQGIGMELRMRPDPLAAALDAIDREAPANNALSPEELARLIEGS